MVEILNRSGHCCSYCSVERIETELAYGSSMEERLLPFGLKDHQPKLCTHVAFDNFDRYVETSSGKDTLHDTVGIVYQNKSTVGITSTNEVTQNDTVIDNLERGLRSRRKYQSNFNCTIEPFIPLHSQTTRLTGNDPKVPSNCLHIDA